MTSSTASSSSGALKWVRERAEVEFDKDGRAVEGIGTVQDITERKRAQEELLRVNRAHRALSSCNEALIRATEESAWLDQVCRIIVDEAGYRFCWVGRAEHDEAKTVTAVAQAGVDEGYLKAVNVTWADTDRGRGPTGTCIRTGQTQIVKDTATDPAFAPWRAEALKRGYASIIAIPLVVDAEPFGALSIYAAEAEAFRDEEVTLLSELAGDLGYGVTTLRVRAEQQRAEEEIRTLNAELEQRVRARTADLEAARDREARIGFRIQQMLLLDAAADGRARIAGGGAHDSFSADRRRLLRFLQAREPVPRRDRRRRHGQGYSRRAAGGGDQEQFPRGAVPPDGDEQERRSCRSPRKS